MSAINASYVSKFPSIPWDWFSDIICYIIDRPLTPDSPLCLPTLRVPHVPSKIPSTYISNNTNTTTKVSVYGFSFVLFKMSNLCRSNNIQLNRSYFDSLMTPNLFYPQIKREYIFTQNIKQYLQEEDSSKYLGLSKVEKLRSRGIPQQKYTSVTVNSRYRRPYEVLFLYFCLRSYLLTRNQYRLHLQHKREDQYNKKGLN